MEWAVFVPTAALALAGGVGVIAARQPVHSALALLMVLASLAVSYLLLAAQFIAVLQVIIYAGAIVVLFLFVIMLLHARSGEGPREKLPRQRAEAYVFAALYLGVLLAAALGAAAPLASIAAEFGTAQQVGESLFTTYLLPFELASVILLVGIVAATVLGRRPPEHAGRGKG
ncbi:MAG: NADH-quinone oxidoreductase subunit J [Armatimonadetes bacterium]|nr:NADH-quinone oxidoreductase subunit J [Armatimonadota bacterium]